MSETKRTNAGNVTTVATEGYDYSVPSRMVGRSGSSSPLGGKEMHSKSCMATRRI